MFLFFLHFQNGLQNGIHKDNKNKSDRNAAPLNSSLNDFDISEKTQILEKRKGTKKSLSGKTKKEKNSLKDNDDGTENKSEAKKIHAEVKVKPLPKNGKKSKQIQGQQQEITEDTKVEKLKEHFPDLYI